MPETSDFHFKHDLTVIFLQHAIVHSISNFFFFDGFKTRYFASCVTSRMKDCNLNNWSSGLIHDTIIKKA